MPDVPGTLKPPRLASAPASPAAGQLYYDTGTNTLYWWNGTSWVSSAGAGAPPDATTSSKGIVQLAGDLAGTAASPQIATGAIVDTDVAAANKDGAAATPSMRTLGSGAQQALAGNKGVQLISTIGPLGAAASSIDFTSIPQTFTHLQVVGHVTFQGAAVSEVGVRLNNDSGANYEYGGMVVASAGAPANFYAVNTTRWRVAEAGNSGGEFCAFTFVLPIYTLGYRKHYHSTFGGYDGNGNMVGTAGGRYYATVAAVTRLFFFATNGANFDLGSMMSLYGMP